MIRAIRERVAPRQPTAVVGALGLLAVLAAPSAPSAPAAQTVCDPCVVGVVLDGPGTWLAELLAAFEPSVVELTAPRFEVVLPAAKRRTGDSTPAGVRRAIEASLADPDVDIVVTAGPLATHWAARRGALPKPVVGAFVVNPMLQEMPLVMSSAGERASGMPNLSYVTASNDFPEDVRRFREVVGFERLTFLVGAPLPGAAPGLEAALRSGLMQLDQEGVPIDVVRAGASADEMLAALPPAAEAVYVLAPLQLPRGDFDRLVRGLNERRLPAFSFLGRSDVDRGLLMGFYNDDSDVRRLGRRLALHVLRILRGEDAGELPIDFQRDRRMTLNMATARTLGVRPGWRILTEAELLHTSPPVSRRRLSLTAAAREAVQANLDLAAEDRGVAAGRQLVREARSRHRPRVFLEGVAQQIDEDRAAASFGNLPSRLVAGSIGVSQLVYSDAVRAKAEIAEHRHATREQSRAERRLDIVHAAAVAFLDVLRATVFERIQQENLAATRSNLESAEARRRIGVAGASEIVRWENELATNRRAVLEAGASRRVAAIALNRLLHRPLEEPFETVEVNPQDIGLLGGAAFEQYVGDPFVLGFLGDFLARDAVRHAPELRQLDAAIAAQERTALAARRVRRTPEIVAHGELTGRLQGAGAFDPNLLPVGLDPQNRFHWTVGVSASLPLFEGGALGAARARAARELEELRLRRRAAAERVEQRLRSAVHFAGASFAGIELAKDAADAARRNLALIADAYEEGGVSILDLLDAQHAALVANAAAANAVYDHLIDVMDVQRAVGRFGFFAEAADSAAFAARLRAFVAAAGHDPRDRP